MNVLVKSVERFLQFHTNVILKIIVQRVVPKRLGGETLKERRRSSFAIRAERFSKYPYQTTELKRAKRLDFARLNVVESIKEAQNWLRRCKLDKK